MKSKIKNYHNLTEGQQTELANQIAIMQKYQHGRLIEELFIGLDNLDAGWTPSIEPTWDWASFEYRVAEVQHKFSPTEFIRCEDDKEIEVIPNSSGLRIKKKTNKKQIELSQVPKNQSDKLTIKLKEIDDHYNSLTRLTFFQYVRLLFKG